MIIVGSHKNQPSLTIGKVKMTLTKADLVQQVYKNHNNLTKTEAVNAVEAFLKLSKDTSL